MHTALDILTSQLVWNTAEALMMHQQEVEHLDLDSGQQLNRS